MGKYQQKEQEDMQDYANMAAANQHKSSTKEMNGMPDCHTFVSYFRVLQMSAIPRVFGLQL